jgi:hypothetical protein
MDEEHTPKICRTDFPMVSEWNLAETGGQNFVFHLS